MSAQEVEALGIRILTPYERDVGAWVLDAALVAEVALSERTSLAIIRSAVRFPRGGIVRRATLALVREGLTRSTITVRGDALGEVARILAGLARELEYADALAED